MIVRHQINEQLSPAPARAGLGAPAASTDYRPLVVSGVVATGVAASAAVAYWGAKQKPTTAAVAVSAVVGATILAATIATTWAQK